MLVALRLYSLVVILEVCLLILLWFEIMQLRNMSCTRLIIICWILSFDDELENLTIGDKIVDF